MVADVHRTLLYGGCFIYPADRVNLQGKLRLLYEGAPMAFIVEIAGGKAIMAPSQPVLDLIPSQIHERTPIILGCVRDVDLVEEVLAKYAPLGTDASRIDSEQKQRGVWKAELPPDTSADRALWQQYMFERGNDSC